MGATYPPITTKYTTWLRLKQKRDHTSPPSPWQKMQMPPAQGGTATLATVGRHFVGASHSSPVSQDGKALGEVGAPQHTHGLPQEALSKQEVSGAHLTHFSDFFPAYS